MFIPPSEEVFELIDFSSSDVANLSLLSNPIVLDPAIARAVRKGEEIV